MPENQHPYTAADQIQLSELIAEHPGCEIVRTKDGTWRVPFREVTTNERTAQNPHGLVEGDVVFTEWDRALISPYDAEKLIDGLHVVVMTHPTDGGYTPGALCFVPAGADLRRFRAGFSDYPGYKIQTPLARVYLP